MNWEIIQGWPDYQVSDTGIITQTRRMKIGVRLGRQTGPIPQMKASQKGYMQVQLIDENRRKFFYVHQLVGIYFVPNPFNFPKINHLDNDPENNNYWNLEWCTQKGNIHHALEIGAHPHSEKWNNKKPIVDKMIVDGYGSKYIAEQTGYHIGSISRYKRQTK